MNQREAMQRLKAMGTAQNRKVYRRHGIDEPLYGVSYANLRKLAREIRIDPGLARGLWQTGNHDARVLATMVMDPLLKKPGELDVWVRDLDNYVVTDAFAGMVGRSPHARKKMEAWGRSPKEWRGRAGWTLLAHLAMSKEEIPDSFFEDKLGVIESEIHSRKNRVRVNLCSTRCRAGSRRTSWSR